MELKTYTAQDLAGNAIASPTVYLYEPNTTTLVAGLTDVDDNGLSNPFTGDVNGQIQFRAPTGEYDMRVTGGGRDYTRRVQFIDLDEQVAEAEAQVTLAAAQVTLAAGHVLTSQNNALAAAASAASIQDTAARVGAMLKARGITNIKAIAFKSAEGWELTGNQSYKTETRPTGRFLGDYANATAAWAANYQGVPTVTGDYYWQTSGTIGLFECTTLNASSQRYRAGSDHMPLEACFVASGSTTTSRLRVFDLTDPLMPMWMEFVSGALTMISMSSAPEFTTHPMSWSDKKLAFGCGGGVNGTGVKIIDFGADNSVFVFSGGASLFASNIKNRNSGLSGKLYSAVGFNGNGLNGVSGSAGYFGFAHPGGAAVIKPDRTVVKSSLTDAFKAVSILNGRLYAINDTTSPEQLIDFGPVESLGANFTAVNTWTNATVPALSAATLTALGIGNNSLIIPSASAVDTLWPNPAVLADSLIARRGTTFATPPMKNPELMLICSTVEGSLTGANKISSTFDSDLDGWTATAGPGSATWNSGAVDLVRNSGSFSPLLFRTFTCAAGAVVGVKVTVTAISGSGTHALALSVNGVQSTTVIFTTGTATATFTAASANPTVGLGLILASNATATIDNVEVFEVVEDYAKRSGNTPVGNPAQVFGTLTATAEVAGGVAGLSGFTVNTNYLEAPNPWDGIGTGEAYASGAFKCAANNVFQILFEISFYDGAYQDSRFLVYLNDTGTARVLVSSDGNVTTAIAESASVYDDGLMHTWVARKTATHYLLDIDGQQVAAVAVGSHGNLTFNASAKLIVGRNGSGSLLAPNSTIWFAGAGKTALADEEVSLMHTHMRNLILGKAALDEIPSALAYNPVTKAVEMVGATYRQTMIDGAITSSVAHGQGTTPAVATGNRGEISIGGATSISISVPERNLRQYNARRTTERFTVTYAGNATRTLFPDPAVATEMAVTIGARPVRVADAGVVQTEGAAESYTVADYGLGRNVVKFAVAPGNGNDVIVEFEREVWK